MLVTDLLHSFRLVLLTARLFICSIVRLDDQFLPGLYYDESNLLHLNDRYMHSDGCYLCSEFFSLLTFLKQGLSGCCYGSYRKICHFSRNVRCDALSSYWSFYFQLTTVFQCKLGAMDEELGNMEQVSEYCLYLNVAYCACSKTPLCNQSYSSGRR